MRQIAELTQKQIDQAWELAFPIKGEDPDEVRYDLVGARIHRKKYNLEEEYGWVVEYILDEKFLEDYATTNADIFCKANIRVLYFKNHLKNANNFIGEIAEWYMDNGEYNTKQPIAWVYSLTNEHKDELKEIFGLSDEIINSL